MATLEDLSESGKLETIDPLSDGALPMRRLLGTPDFIIWLRDALPDLDHKPQYSAVTPFEQVVVLFEKYASGGHFMKNRMFKKLNRTPELFVWEFKTEEVRVFGWFPARDAFVCCFGESADKIKRFDSYGTYIAKTHYVRHQLDLDEPKYVKSGRYEDVISD